MVYVSPYTHYFDGWDARCRLQLRGYSISTSYCLISHRAFEGLLPLPSCPRAVGCIYAGLAKHELIKLLKVCALISVKTQGDRWAAALSDEICVSFIAQFACLPVIFRHTHVQAWRLFSWEQTYAQSCYLVLFLLCCLIVSFSLLLWSSPHSLSFTPSFIVSLFLQCHSPSVFLSSLRDSETISTSWSLKTLFAVMLNAPNQRSKSCCIYMCSDILLCILSKYTAFLFIYMYNIYSVKIHESSVFFYGICEMSLFPEHLGQPFCQSCWLSQPHKVSSGSDALTYGNKDSVMSWEGPKDIKHICAA